MSYADLISVLKKDDPKVDRTVRAVRTIGSLCLMAALWNIVTPFLSLSEFSLFSFSDYYSYFTMISLSGIGALLFYSANEINKMNISGIHLIQFSIIALCIIIVTFGYNFIERIAPFQNYTTIVYVYKLLSGVILLQFLLPAYLGIRYLNRLKVKFSGKNNQDSSYSYIQKAGISEYRDSLLDLGIGQSFLILIIPFILLILFINKTFGYQVVPFVFVPCFAIMFYLPVVFNSLKSPFEKSRILHDSFKGGGSIFVFSGSWPFFRLLVYDDGLEIRVMFNRFFIPYNEADEIAEKRILVNNSLLIKSNLPGVPAYIRFFGKNTPQIIDTINQAKEKKLAS